MYSDGGCGQKQKESNYVTMYVGVQTWYSTAPLGEIQDCFLRLGGVAKATSTEEADRIFAGIVSDLKELTGDVEGMGKYMILVRLCLHCSQP